MKFEKDSSKVVGAFDDQLEGNRLSKMAEFIAPCQLANDWTCFIQHKL